ncbi:MAG: YncE family protein [Planctomycetota bacterium]
MPLPLATSSAPFAAVALAAIACTAALSAQAATAPTPEDRLLVANKADHSLSIFIPGERREAATVPTGRGPHEVAVDPTGTLAVVSDYGDRMPGSSLTVVDVFAGKAVRTIQLARSDAEVGESSTGPTTATTDKPAAKAYLRPHGIRFVAADRVVVTSEATRRLLLVNVITGAIERTWTTPQTTMHMVALTSDGKRAAATSIREGSVVFFALAGDGRDNTAVTAPIACGDGSEGLAIHPTSGETWVGNRAANTVSVVDAAGKITKTLASGDFPFRIAFTPDGKHALVTCADGGQLQVFDAATHELRREISIHGDRSEQSAMPMGIVTDPDGQRAFVTCNRGEFVAVIDLTKGELVDRWPARAGCDGIAWARRRAATSESTRPLEGPGR